MIVLISRSKPFAVVGHHFDRNQVTLFDIFRTPRDINQPFRFAHRVRYSGSRRLVHGHAASARDVANDVVAGHGRAAAREVDQQDHRRP